MGTTLVRVSNGLRVTTSRRYGHERLEVETAAGDRIGWYDPESRRHDLLASGMDAAFWQAIREAGPAVAGPTVPAARNGGANGQAGTYRGQPSPVTDFVGTPDERTTVRSPITAARERLESAAARVGQLLGLRGRSGEDGTEGERAVNQVLEKLQKTRHWYTTDRTVIAPDGTAVDHMVFGPSGVYAIDTKFLPRSKVDVARKLVYVDGQRRDFSTKILTESERITERLSAAVRLKVTVTPLVVLVQAARVQHWRDWLPNGVKVLPLPALIAWLGLRPTTRPKQDLAPQLRELALDPHTWGR